MSISERRNAVLKSNISIKSIGSGILNLAKGLKSATGISQNISTQQKKKEEELIKKFYNDNSSNKNETEEKND